MGRNSGSIRETIAGGGGGEVAFKTSGKRVGKRVIRKILQSMESLDSLKDREVVKQLHKAVSRFESVMGVRERSIKVADLSGVDAYGITFLNKNGSQGIVLNKTIFNGKRKEIESTFRKENYDTGFQNKTNRPIQHALTHELAHATWSSHYKDKKHQKAGIEIKKLYKKWRRDRKKTEYGEYGRTNVNEFWAEVIAKGIHGNPDKYTKRAIGIAKKYRL